VNSQSLRHRRGLWLIGVLLVIAVAGIFWYLSASGKAQVHYATTPVERGDVWETSKSKKGLSNVDAVQGEPLADFRPSGCHDLTGSRHRIHGI